MNEAVFMSIPKQNDIYKQLVSEITGGQLGDAGEIFPTVRSLSESFGASPVTIQKVIHRLRDAGLIVRDGRGMKIARGAKELCRIGIIVPQLDNPFYSRLLNEFEREGTKRGIDILSAGGAEDPERSRHILQVFAKNKAEGICICASSFDTNLLSINIPVIGIGNRSLLQNFPVVEVDNIRAGEIAAEHLISQGCRDFFYVSHTHITQDDRMLGFSRALARRGFHLPQSHILSENENMQSDELVNFFQNNLSTFPAGVFCYHDLWAMRVLRATHFLSLKVPDDIAVVGFDNLPICTETLPPLSSIAYPFRKLAEGALDILNEIRSGKDVGLRRTLLEPQLVIRQSSLIRKG